MRRWCPAIALLIAAGCGGGNKPAPATPDDGAAEREAALAKRRADACDALCPRLTQCALEDAKATMPPDQVAELEEVTTAHTEQCRRECNDKQPSPRQLGQVEQCLGAETACAPLLDCLDNARPKPAAAPAPAATP